MLPLRETSLAASSTQPLVIAWNAAQGTQAPLQRCVSLPFTAPALVAMRVRRGLTGGLEMLLSNPAGGRGIYVASWTTLRAFAAPSMHDILLAQRIIDPVTLAGPLSPASVRAASIAVAIDGHAGRRVAQAAGQARRAEQLGLRRLRAHLLLEMARALDIPGSRSALNDPWTTQPDEHGGWLAEAPLLLARRLDCPTAWLPSELAGTVARIAALAWPFGIGPAAARARLPRIVQLLSKAASHVRPGQGTSGQRAGPGNAGPGNAGIDNVISARIAQAEAALHRARALLDDPIELLTLWRADQAALIDTLERPDWLLDGWDRLCLLPGDAAELGALVQMLLYEGECRIGLNRSDLDGAGLPGFGAGAALDRLARNEALRLQELRLHDPDLADFDD